MPGISSGEVPLGELDILGDDLDLG